MNTDPEVANWDETILNSLELPLKSGEEHAQKSITHAFVIKYATLHLPPLNALIMHHHLATLINDPTIYVDITHGLRYVSLLLLVSHK